MTASVTCLRSVAAAPATAEVDAIGISHLWKAFHDRRRNATLVAIGDVSLTVARGAFVCICGPSGCGKSTLVRILAGLDHETTGSVVISERRGSTAPPAMVFQEASLFPWMTIEENIAFPLTLAGLSPAARRERVRDLLAMTRLEDFAGAYPHQLSGGMRQRASVARALVDPESDILLMDEPFGALDEQTRIELQQELLRIWERTGKTVLFITHSVEEALTLADRVIVMSARPGEIVADIAVPFPRPRDVLDLRRLPAFGEMTYEIWQLLARHKTKPSAEILAASAKPVPENLAHLARPSVRERVLSILGVFSPLFVLLVWECLVRANWMDTRFFPAPSDIAVVFWDELAYGTMAADALATLKRVGIGFLAGAIPAILLGLGLGLWPMARQLVAPIFSALYPVPKIATFPLLLLLLGVGEAPKYTVIAIVVFFLVFFNTMTGVRFMPKIYVDVARNLGASDLQKLRYVAAPAALPGIFTGLRLGLGTAFVVIAAVEFVGAKSGLGYAIWSSWQTFAVEKMYANIIAISALGYLCILLVDLVEYLSTPWSRA